MNKAILLIFVIPMALLKSAVNLGHNDNPFNACVNGYPKGQSLGCTCFYKDNNEQFSNCVLIVTGGNTRAQRCEQHCRGLAGQALASDRGGWHYQAVQGSVYADCTHGGAWI